MNNWQGAKRGCLFALLLPQHGLVESESGKVDILGRGQLADV
jgi:hypothetical protein